ncbi:Mitogen-activated_protein kinase [Hexamita inflata]|uniref:Mitogen-activated protein kinase n=1 Tax=Hexamita inflata TaxID=28002 RepID=A0AA86P5U7_9EUKA|nr:Mitogen-activated protein kinase [Hexamita inflata]
MCLINRFDTVQEIQLGTNLYYKAVDKKYNRYILIKRIQYALNNESTAEHCFREILFLQELNHDNVIRLSNVLRAENDSDIYLVFEFMETDLQQVIRANILQDVHKKQIIYQLLKSVQFLHSNNLVHRAINPQNCLIDANSTLKLQQFGFVHQLSECENIEPVLSDRIATRWYTAPEILLGSTKSTKSEDMWAVGCILGELLLGKPLFPGTSTMSQLERILEVTAPTLEDINSINTPFASSMINSIQNVKRKNLKELINDENAADLLEKLLRFNPNERITAEEALKHPFVGRFHGPENQIAICKQSQIFECKKKNYVELLNAEIDKWEKDIKEQ